MSFFRNYSVIVAKSKFERLSGVGVWLANPSILLLSLQLQPRRFLGYYYIFMPRSYDS